jgi:hypothetical protein
MKEFVVLIDGQAIGPSECLSPRVVERFPDCGSVDDTVITAPGFSFLDRKSGV